MSVEGGIVINSLHLLKFSNSIKISGLMFDGNSIKGCIVKNYENIAFIC